MHRYDKTYNYFFTERYSVNIKSKDYKVDEMKNNKSFYKCRYTNIDEQHNIFWAQLKTCLLFVRFAANTVGKSKRNSKASS